MFNQGDCNNDYYDDCNQGGNDFDDTDGGGGDYDDCN